MVVGQHYAALRLGESQLSLHVGRQVLFLVSQAAEGDDCFDKIEALTALYIWSLSLARRLPDMC